MLATMTAEADQPLRQKASEEKLPTIPAQSMPNRSPLELLIMARNGLAEAAEESRDGQRYATAHLAALRAAAAVLAIRARPATGRRNRVTNVWELLIRVAPELGEWADFFLVPLVNAQWPKPGYPKWSPVERQTICCETPTIL